MAQEWHVCNKWETFFCRICIESWSDDSILPEKREKFVQNAVTSWVLTE